MIKLDKKDKKILTVLANNSRLQISEISKVIELSRDNVTYRIKRLEKLEAIQNYVPMINFTKLGYRIYHILFIVDEKDENKKKEFIKHLKSHKNTLELLEYSDRWDFEWKLIARSLNDFDQQVTKVMEIFSDIILEKQTLANINNYVSRMFPYKAYDKLILDKKRKKIEKVKEVIKYKYDEKDLKIIKVLSNNSRVSTYQLAEKVKLSADAIRLRIKKIEDCGIIKKFTIIPNLEVLGFNSYTFTVQLSTLDTKNEKKLETFIKDHPYILKAEKVLGTWDLWFNIISSSPKEFHKTIKQIKSEFSNIVKKYDAYLLYKRHYVTAVPKIICK
ncbi:AsnC family transcriptional regulator [archaeon]|jgi:DNA-binding Lrp family transcriptional regulator|nr:AsnC family transcriptional regulator [archaeon]MBT3451416.1 AsnC family transcriptional regulator [archaeon]MBT6869239.1 AsnC family transcriptional regulator [archaeon]MBT7193637.1 AsnC family transcriptional regulator [archaeon]MBT7380255.1 AsnC family transcriptional regulator [archaeon]